MSINDINRTENTTLSEQFKNQIEKS